jgi:hypothetical protein
MITLKITDCYGKTLVALEVTGCKGNKVLLWNLLVSIKVNGCYENHLIVAKVGRCLLPKSHVVKKNPWLL